MIFVIAVLKSVHSSLSVHLVSIALNLCFTFKILCMGSSGPSMIWTRTLQTGSGINTMQILIILYTANLGKCLEKIRELYLQKLQRGTALNCGGGTWQSCPGQPLFCQVSVTGVKGRFIQIFILWYLASFIAKSRVLIFFIWSPGSKLSSLLARDKRYKEGEFDKNITWDPC